MEQCVLQNSIWKNCVLGLIGTSFVLAGLVSGENMPWGIAFFGLIAILFGYRALDRRPRVTIDDNGITDLRNSAGTIPWRDISGVRVVSAGLIDLIYVTVKNPDQWRPKLSVMYRITWKIFPKRRVISIPLQNMSVPTNVVNDFQVKSMKLHGVGSSAAPVYRSISNA
ncbi:MAG: PH domain-containing protein [Pseudomonadota bacterium]|nr:PH domain-containing protein [Pseudomonadota bacterium]